MILRAFLVLTLCFSCVFAFNQSCALLITDSSFSELNESTILFVGEKHRQPCNYPFQEHLFTHFYERQNRQNLLIEYGPSFGYLVQEFVETGDTNLFNSICFFGYGEDVLFDWIKGLREKYKNKPIRIYGVDVENQPNLMLYCIYRIYKQNGIEDSRLGKFIKKDTVTVKQINDLASLFLYDFKNNEGTYKNQLGKDFEMVSLIFRNYESAIKYYEFRDRDSMQVAFKFREIIMTYNIQSVVNRNDSNAKYFGQFGHIHTTQRPIKEVQKITDWNSAAIQLWQRHGITSFSIGIINFQKIDYGDYQLFGEELNIMESKPEIPIITKSKTGNFNYLIQY